jgi:hypothetical protein
MNIWRWSWVVFGVCGCVCGVACLWTILERKGSSVPIIVTVAVIAPPALFWLDDRLRRGTGIGPKAYLALMLCCFTCMGALDGWMKRRWLSVVTLGSNSVWWAVYWFIGPWIASRRTRRP